MSETTAWGRNLAFWTRVTLVYLMVITVTGAAVRLTSSGLGCSDWPTCETDTLVVEASFHPLVEFGNRVVSGLAIVPVIGALLAARRGRPDVVIWIRLIIAGFVGQLLLGMAVTRTELDPRVVLGHFLLSIVLIWLAAVLDHRVRSPRPVSPGPRGDRLTLVTRALVAVTAAVISIGTLVTGSGPHTGSNEAEPVPRLGFDIFEITRVHGIAVWVLAATIGYGLWIVRSDADPLRRGLTMIAVIATAQGAIGYLQYFTGVPALLVGLHIAGAVLLWTSVSLFALRVGDARVTLPDVVQERIAT